MQSLLPLESSIQWNKGTICVKDRYSTRWVADSGCNHHGSKSKLLFRIWLARALETFYCMTWWWDMGLEKSGLVLILAASLAAAGRKSENHMHLAYLLESNFWETVSLAIFLLGSFNFVTFCDVAIKHNKQQINVKYGLHSYRHLHLTQIQL